MSINRGCCEFNGCQCPIFISSNHCKEICDICQHGHVWHQNMTDTDTAISTLPSAPPPTPKKNYNNNSANVSKEMFDMSCLICHEHIRSVLFLPCKHFVICHNCLKSTSTKTCIISRETITSNIAGIFL